VVKIIKNEIFKTVDEMCFYKKYNKNPLGFTLIEILVTLVILSIVLLSFMSFFTQSSLFTQKNNEKLTAINLAQETVVTIKNQPSYFQKVAKYSTGFPEPEKTILNVNSIGVFNENPNYRLGLEIAKDYSYNLYKIHVQIYDLKNNLLAETYHYLKGPS
jgi:prepilin-type N-terminal cleavage/methylation domain-containing protein